LLLWKAFGVNPEVPFSGQLSPPANNDDQTDSDPLGPDHCPELSTRHHLHTTLSAITTLTRLLS
jgi:hypothetical protein